MRIFDFIDGLEIEEEKAAALKDALKKLSFYRNVLYKVGVMPAAIERITRTIDPAEIDTTQEELMMEKARIEWAGFIPKTEA